jgi:predicted Zn finger-like uncharacterized protein
MPPTTDYEGTCPHCGNRWYVRLDSVADPRVQLRCPRCGNEGTGHRLPYIDSLGVD